MLEQLVKEISNTQDDEYPDDELLFEMKDKIGDLYEVHGRALLEACLSVSESRPWVLEILVNLSQLYKFDLDSILSFDELVRTGVPHLLATEHPAVWRLDGG